MKTNLNNLSIIFSTDERNVKRIRKGAPTQMVSPSLNYYFFIARFTKNKYFFRDIIDFKKDNLFIEHIEIEDFVISKFFNLEEFI